MNRIPCKKCPQCGLFNDFTIEECECGKKLNNIEAQFIDTDKLSPEQYGEVDTSLKVYVQKCSACGALNYTDDPVHPVKVCYNCHKTRIAAIAPTECVEEDGEEKQDASAPEVSVSSAVSSLNTQQVKGQVLQSQAPYDDDDDDDDDDDFIHWQGILENIQKTVGSTPNSKASQAKTNQQNAQQPVGQSVTQTPSDFDVDDDDNDDNDDNDDDDEVGDWSGILGTTPKQKNATTPKQQTVTTPAKKNITLTAIRYGRLSFTVEAGQDTYMLGRSAKQGSFLSQDGRVGNEHCYLFYRNGAWFVKDNNSQNGTAVNSRDIGLNGECMLSDRDELKLGHHPDSMAFRITIN